MSKLAVNLHSVKDGEQCMAFLRKQGQYADAPTADIILLDLNMPVKNGWDTFEQLTASLPLIPVIITTARSWRVSASSDSFTV